MVAAAVMVAANLPDTTQTTFKGRSDEGFRPTFGVGIGEERERVRGGRDHGEGGT